ncbi:unnamed protein product [Ostreobium quekettii]|uniref:RRM domain-containing protein n=1 Tax=Ostreobium quekettii TaxID=121088 RepID=A0A8S1JB97_9CHLO|nr:unnamed protein product [Ostreobium quekettii]
MSGYAYEAPGGHPPNPYEVPYGYDHAASAYGAQAQCDGGQYASPGEEIRTIFITGFPDDVKERELNNMLRFLPGYQASQMNWKNGQAQGFALFSHPQAARAAVSAIHSLCFDENSILRAEMARKNMYLREDACAKRPRAAGGPEVAPVAPTAYAPVTNNRDNPPCNTLFIGNLSDAVSKQELEALFAHQPGFKQMKLVRAPRCINCFVEFTDLASAMAVHQSLQALRPNTR